MDDHDESETGKTVEMLHSMLNSALGTVGMQINMGQWEEGLTLEEHARKTARLIFEACGRLSPVALIAIGDLTKAHPDAPPTAPCSMVVIGGRFANESDKELFTTMVETGARALSSPLVVIAAESWMVVGSLADVGHLKGRDLKSHPCRKECITLMAQDSKGGTRNHFAIIETVDGKRKLGEFIMADSGEMSGRMTGLVPMATTGPAN